MEAVGIREFRENLADYVERAAPVAITRHGETVGYFLPTPRQRTEEEKARLNRAKAQLDKASAAAGATEDELREEFEPLLKKKRK